MAGLALQAALALARRQAETEWAGSALNRWAGAGPEPEGLAAAARELRPPDLSRGRAILNGRFDLAGARLEVGPGGDPWDRPSPSRAFAEALHRMEWLADLLAAPGGPRAALSLALGWRAVFGRWNAFSWSAAILERRTHALACALPALLAEAGPDEGRLLLASLARQARALLALGGDPAREADQACAVALAGAVLAGRAGETLLEAALPWLEHALRGAVLADGGHASRAPEAGLELLLDLRILGQVLAERGQAPPQALTDAVAGLAHATGVLTLGDGRLAALQGGGPSEPARVAAAGPDPRARSSSSLPDSGFERLVGRSLVLVADAGAPAPGAWSGAACAQPLAIEVCAGRDRLIGSPAWSPRAPDRQDLRLAPAASTATLDSLSCGELLTGWPASGLGPRLVNAPPRVRARRHDGETASWLELGHDGWLKRFGLIQERRLYLDRAADELRGEDLVTPQGAPGRAEAPQALVVRFLIPVPAKASVALDGKSVLLQPRGAGAAGSWWLRTDAPEIAVEPAMRLGDGRLGDGRAGAAARVVLRALLGADRSARIRWKLVPAERAALTPAPPAS